jgi:hypothetical protein
MNTERKIQTLREKGARAYVELREARRKKEENVKRKAK